MYERNFETVCKYANLRYKPRQGESRATDMSHKYFYNHWKHTRIMVLYEGDKRILKGHDTAEVCWICINEYGGVDSIPARHLRMMEEKPGFSFVNGVWSEMISLLEWYYNRQDN